MPNPYETPVLVEESNRSTYSLWRRVLGGVLMLLGLPIALYGLFVLVIATVFMGSLGGFVPTSTIVMFGGLILFMGTGFVACGFGTWTRRKRWASGGLWVFLGSIVVCFILIRFFPF